MLITIDTLRMDHLGAYGSRSVPTPNLDRLAAEGTLFAQAISPVPLTLPSHTSMMTGLYPFEHGVLQNGVYRLPERAEPLAERLASAGYQTGAFVGSFILSARFGLKQGFATYDAPFDHRPGSLKVAERTAEAVITAARRWLAGVGAAPFFLWVHVYDPHAPFRPPGAFAARFAANPYGGEIAYVDAALGPLLEELRGRPRPPVIVVAGDHGESLGEHGEDHHGFFIYDSVMRVPLIVWGPHVFPGGGRHEGQVGLIDLFPTILEVAAVPVPAAQHAVSLVPALFGRSLAARPQLLETPMPTAQFDAAALSAMRTEDWKLIESPERELYQLAGDRGEERNVAALQREIATVMAARLQSARAAATGPEPRELQVQVDPELQQALESLGYVGTRPSERRDETVRKDAKEVVHLLHETKEGKQAYAARDYAKAIGHFDRVIQECPTARSALMLKGRAAVAMKQYEVALSAFEGLVKAFPDEAPGHYNAGVALLVLQRSAAAVRALERSLELDATAVQTVYTLGVAHLAAGDAASAKRFLGDYLRLAPQGEDAAAARRVLGELAAAHVGAPGS